jgi:hypothetical protein
MITRLRLLLPTLRRLGFGAVASVAAYRLACRFGLYRHWLPVRQWQGGGDFFAPTVLPAPVISPASRATILARADKVLAGELVYFSSIGKKIGNPPDWFEDPFSGGQLAQEGHWSALDEFSTGDIKNVWEASRFEWVPLLARAWRLTGDDRYLATLNGWLLDWLQHNPINAGPNWKCGQEAAMRLINLLLAARIFDTHSKPSPELVQVVTLHCARILPTIRYAVAQNNNHGTSEAAALFIGGAWLLHHAENQVRQKDARRWRKAGRCWLEDRVAALVAADGSFSQYSVNYHRVLVDTLCQVEIWRTELKEPPFSEVFHSRCRAAVAWLAQLTDAGSGDAPNLGSNDGARLYDLSSAPYRDFRPSVQLASVLFRGGRAYGKGTWDEPLLWLGREASGHGLPADDAAVIHGDGGDLILRGSRSWGLVRFARFRFRPSHADCLHFDLWWRGRNILRDGGTFSYNTEPQWLDYFSGTASHNTVQFDGRDQMARIGRFLFGEWLEMDECGMIRREGNSLSWSGSYTDGRQARHRRTVRVTGNVWQVVDQIGGFRDKAVLRWRLSPGAWKLDGNICVGALARVHITTTAPLRRLELTTGWESLCYQQKTELPVLEVEVGPGTWTIVTEITLQD